jgi:hypothetical protein
VGPAKTPAYAPAPHRKRFPLEVSALGCGGAASEARSLKYGYDNGSCAPLRWLAKRLTGGCLVAEVKLKLDSLSGAGDLPEYVALRQQKPSENVVRPDEVHK